jgi:hypothetical protein
LIVLAGDNINGAQSEIAMTNFCAFINHFNIPWTFIFGNHDSEYDNNRMNLAKIGESFSNFLFSEDSSDIDGIGNYRLE